MTSSPRRYGSPDAKNRSVLLDAAEELLLAEGYSAVTARRVAAQAGLKHQLVHYYFHTMDDLFLALFRRRAEQGLEQQAAALASDRPLRALWTFSTDPAGASLTMEFMSLANHREAIRAEVAHYAERLRAAQAEALPGILQRYGIPPETCPPIVLVFLTTCVARVLVLEDRLGMSAGHDETRAYVEDLIQRLEEHPSQHD
ncbi:TetR/AcrR family transcriptional regulator [Streptomyces hokutonensis]|uniref:TetR/AcrR family transcriptional regulator n=1 Tax=Streptomyces hokutonensis TaxID=1306990 RepID=UPI0038133E9D